MKVWGVFESRAVEWTPYSVLITIKKTKEQAQDLLDTFNKHRPWNGEFDSEWDKLMDKYPELCTDSEQFFIKELEVEED
jgi:hypothetical protein